MPTRWRRRSAAQSDADLDLFSFVINLPMHLRADHHERRVRQVLFRMLAEREIAERERRQENAQYAMAMADPTLERIRSRSASLPLPPRPTSATDPDDQPRAFHNAFFTSAAATWRTDDRGRTSEFDMGGPQDTSLLPPRGVRYRRGSWVPRRRAKSGKRLVDVREGVAANSTNTSPVRSALCRGANYLRPQ
jgi:hypothetical protein